PAGQDSWDRRLRAALCSAMAIALLVVPIGAIFPMVPPFGTPTNAVAHATYNDARDAMRLLDGRYESTNRLDGMAPLYRRINAAIPVGSHLLAAVTFPDLLDVSRFHFATLDIAGAVSPRPGIPLTKGGPAVLSYLRALGYNGIVASVTNAPGLYNYRSWDGNLHSGIEDYRAMAAQFIAWAQVLSSLNHDPEVRRVRIDTLEYLSWSTPKGAS
ncbi:MAG TPA: hypothetical protein VG368_06465, partial [Acidimicrobiales bacterium]|nr:hypothetical protein [Acidimicrobiales bacterium]